MKTLTKKPKQSNCGYPGVYFIEKIVKYEARVWIKGFCMSLGFYDSPDDADLAIQQFQVKKVDEDRRKQRRSGDT